MPEYAAALERYSRPLMSSVGVLREAERTNLDAFTGAQAHPTWLHQNPGHLAKDKRGQFAELPKTTVQIYYESGKLHG